MSILDEPRKTRIESPARYSLRPKSQSAPIVDIYNALQRKPGESSRLVLLDLRPLQASDDVIRGAVAVTLDENGQLIFNHNRAPVKLHGRVLVCVYDKNQNAGEPWTNNGVLQAALGYIEALGVSKKTSFLQGGFASFNEMYPFLCGPQQCEDSEPVAYPNEVLVGRLFLGDSKHSVEQLHQLKISAVLHLGMEPSAHASDLPMCHMPVIDDASSTLPLAETFEFLDTHLGRAQRVLVTCDTGNTVSGAVCVGFLMARMKCSLQQAIIYVMKRRRALDLNAGFFRQLSEFQDLQSQAGT